MENGKIFLTATDVAGDMDIGMEDAEQIIRELNERIVRKGGMCIRGKVSAAFYRKMKDTGFLSDEGAVPEDYPLTEKRLLKLKEFCAYSGLGQNMACKFAKETGIEKRIGHKALYDRTLFDRWCDSHKSADI